MTKAYEHAEIHEVFDLPKPASLCALSYLLVDMAW